MGHKLQFNFCIPFPTVLNVFMASYAVLTVKQMKAIVIYTKNIQYFSENSCEILKATYWAQNKEVVNQSPHHTAQLGFYFSGSFSILLQVPTFLLKFLTAMVNIETKHSNPENKWGFASHSLWKKIRLLEVISRFFPGYWHLKDLKIKPSIYRNALEVCIWKNCVPQNR